MIVWHTAFIRADDPAPVASSLFAALTALGYSRYDPFPGGSGTPPALKTFVKQLLSPARDGWVRILGTPDLEAFLMVSQQWPLVYGWFTEADSGWCVLDHGHSTTDAAAFEPYLKPNQSSEAFQRVQSGQLTVVPDEPTNTLLPSDIQQLARDRGVNPKQADRMVERMTSQLFGRLDRDNDGEAGALRGQAQAMLQGGGAEWNSANGQRLRAMAAVLAIPTDWRTPAIEDVREAYSLARRLARNPKALLLPAERDTLKAVPDASSYTAVYVGKA
jgi:hypothetical protein